MSFYSAQLVLAMGIVKVDVISGGSFSSLCFMSVPVPSNLCICAGIASSFSNLCICAGIASLFSLLTSALISTERTPGCHVSSGNAQPKRLCHIRMNVLKCPSLFRCHVSE